MNWMEWAHRLLISLICAEALLVLTSVNTIQIALKRSDQRTPNQAIPTSPLEGRWENQNASSSNVTHIVINANNSGSLQAHVWGKCEPSDCDWGLAEIKSLGRLERTVFDFGFSTTTMEFILLPDDRLLAVYKSVFKDQSGRRDQEHVQFFVRETQPAKDVDSLAATILLKKVAETYRNLASARFESRQDIEYGRRQSAERTTKISTTLISQPAKLRLETAGSAEPRVTISNGDTVWTYFPESNEYTSLPAGKPGSVHSQVSSYALLDQVRESGRITGHGRIGDIDCTIVTLRRNDDHTRNLWIDPKTNFVRKDDSKDVSTVLDGVFSERSVTTFSVARVVDKLDATLFSFDPTTTKAKERPELQKDEPLTSIGTLAPNFTLRNLEGSEVSLTDLRGKLVILDFWATWCGPCRDSMPALELLHRQFKDKGVVVLGIDNEDTETQKAFLWKFGYSFISVVDPARKIANLYKVGGIPTTILIDRTGTIRIYDVGEATFESMSGALHAQGLGRNPE